MMGPNARDYADQLMDQCGYRPWAAKLVGLDNCGDFRREFVHGNRDYSRANGVGSRGIWEYFSLEPGVYEVYERLSWRRTDRYFLRVDEEGNLTRISRDEVLACLKNAC
jgi:hypothetical protein